MSQNAHSAGPVPIIEEHLSGAYRRILQVTVVMSLAAAVITTTFLGWRNGLALAIGAFLAYLNFVWLHHGVELAVQRMAVPARSGPSRTRLALAFAGRYVFVLAIAYVILKGYPQTRIYFMMGLALPVMAAMGEGIYEAVIISKTDQTSD